MLSPVNSIIRQTQKREKLNILCSPTHENYQTILAKTGDNYYMCWFEGMKRWCSNYRKLPQNIHLLDDNTIPNIELDIVLSQNKFDQFLRLKPIANQLHLPLINIEHTLPHKNWHPQQLIQMSSQRADINVFISEFSIKEWGWEDGGDTVVIRHGVDTNTFCPSNKPRKNTILTVANDYINRNWCLNFELYQKVTKGLPTTPVGDTKGFSAAAKDLDDLVNYYQTSRIFLSTASFSPIPCASLESMASQCAIVTTSNPLLDEIIVNGENGFISNDPIKLRGYLEVLLKDENLAMKLGQNARKTIIEKFSESVFVEKWKEIFKRASLIPFIGG